VKRYEKYEKQVSWIVKRYGKRGRKVGWIVIRYDKYGRKQVEYWNDLENMEEK
jgi:hypothetical protein